MILHALPRPAVGSVHEPPFVLLSLGPPISPSTPGYRPKLKLAEQIREWRHIPPRGRCRGSKMNPWPLQQQYTTENNQIFPAVQFLRPHVRSPCLSPQGVRSNAHTIPTCSSLLPRYSAAGGYKKRRAIYAGPSPKSRAQNTMRQQAHSSCRLRGAPTVH